MRRNIKEKRPCLHAPSLSADLCASGLPVEQSPHEVLGGLPPGGLHKHDDLNRSNDRSDHGADAAQFEVTSPGDRLINPVKVTVHKSNSFLK